MNSIVQKVAVFQDTAPCSQQINRRFSKTYHLHLGRGFLARLIFDPEDGGDTFLRNVGSYTDYTALYPTRQLS
jgi:hypothetical protein